MAERRQDRPGRNADHHWRWLAVAGFCVVLVAYEWSALRQGGALGFPLDDSWIHAQFARNLATGLGFSYSDGVPVSGSTAPAWTLAVAGAYVVFRDAMTAGKILGVLFAVGSVLAAFRLARVISGDTRAGVVGALLMAAAPVTSWGAVSGMEVPLSSFLVVGGAAWLLEDHAGGRPPYRGLAVLAIACLARPENTVIFFVAAGAAIAWGRSLRGMLRRFLIAAALLAVVVGPWIGFNYHSHGRPLPTTFYAKSGAGIVRALDTSDTAMAKRAVVTYGAGGIRGFVQTVHAQLPIVGLLALVGAVLCFSRRGTPGRWWIPVALLVVPVAMGAVAPQRVKPDNVRYTAQLVSMVAVLAAAGLWELVKRLPRRLRLASVAAAIGWLLFSGAGRPAEYGLAVRNINELHVAMGRWVARHVPPGATVAANDVGAIAYFGRRRVLDLEGLVSPRSLRYRDGAPDRGLRIVEAERPDFLVISPSWYPDIMGQPARFVEEYRITISDNIAAGDASLVVLSTPWTPHRLTALTRPHAGGS